MTNSRNSLRTSRKYSNKKSKKHCDLAVRLLDFISSIHEEVLMNMIINNRARYCQVTRRLQLQP